MGETLERAGTRVQLCGRLAVRIHGRRIDADLPGRQGRLAFAFLAVNRNRQVSRDALVEVLWPEQRPALVDTALNALVSKLRKAIEPGAIEGRSELRLVLPDAWLDVEAAFEGIHRAEAAVARGAWTDVWGPARVALHIVRRGFFHGESAPWVVEQRATLEDVERRALEAIAESSLGLGPAEHDSALRSGRGLVRLSPFRESGYRLLMRALAAEANVAEALNVYEGLRSTLRNELGAAPSPETQALHRQLLG